MMRRHKALQFASSVYNRTLTTTTTKETLKATGTAKTAAATTNKSTFPTDKHIIQSFHYGDYETAITNFSRLPPTHRTIPLYEAAITACAQIPDAIAAQSLLNVMPFPTRQALSVVVSAWCRQRDPSSAAHILETAVHHGRADIVDYSLLMFVSRSAHRWKQPHVVARLDRLEPDVNTSSPSATYANVDDCYDQQRHVENNYNQSQLERHLQSQSIVSASALQTSSKRNVQLEKSTARAERRLRSAVPNVDRVHDEWLLISSDPDLRREPGVLSAVISALSLCHNTTNSTRFQKHNTSPLALNTFMTWVQRELYDPSTNLAYPYFTNNRSSSALLLTSATTALSTCASSAPSLALSAYDALLAIQLPGFQSSLPLTGAYLKALQHAHLPLEQTMQRIQAVWKQHVQFDERAFSMALGAILKSRGSLPADRLKEAKEWLTNMRRAGISLTVHTYNVLAGQLRYGGDVRLGVQLLREMGDAGVQPTAVTYGLVFAACVSRGEFTAWERRGEKASISVSLWKKVVDGVGEHMNGMGVAHTPYSALSLAKAYAHLGEIDMAFRVFDTYIDVLLCDDDVEIATQSEGAEERRNTMTRVLHGNYGTGDYHNADMSSEEQKKASLKKAFYQLMHTIAHARECTSDSCTAIMTLADRMQHEFDLQPNGTALDCLTVSLVRAGRIHDIVPMIGAWTFESSGMSVTGMKYALQAVGLEPDAKAWWEGGVRNVIVLQNEEVIRKKELVVAVRAVVMQFARLEMRNICEDIMNASGVMVGNLQGVYKGREFSTMRAAARGKDNVETQEEKMDLEVGDQQQTGNVVLNRGRNNLDHRTVRRTIENGSVLPLT